MERQWEKSLDSLPGVGPARAKALARLGLFTVGDLLSYVPRDYEDRRVQGTISKLPEETPVCFEAMVTEAFRTSRIRAGMELTKGKIADHSAQVSVTFFNQSYVPQRLVYGKSYVFYGKLSGSGMHRQMTNPFFEPVGERKLTGGIMPVYRLTAGISQNFLTGLVRLCLPAAEEIQEVLPSQMRIHFSLAKTKYSYQNIHFPACWEALALARRRLIFEELLCLSLGLLLLRKRRAEGGAVAFSNCDLSAFYEALPFALTHAQRRVLEEIVHDVGQAVPMNRLLQGDVGSGKTAVAAGCLYLAFRNGQQSVLMAPTDLLARQHYRTLQTLLGKLGLRVGLLVGSLPEKQKRTLREMAAKGEIDLLIGTQALLSDAVSFVRLGLVITDEQHRFGVFQRAGLSAKAGEAQRAHVLVMSATPIPRTLALMVYGDLDVSRLEELPPGRMPVQTILLGEEKRKRLYAFLRKQVLAGRQVYIVCPTVEEGQSEHVTSAQAHGARLQEEVFPDLSLAVLHGRMKSKEKERIMLDFAEGRTQILVSTTVIEVGVDVPNATVMVIENAERFGLSQLHQLRGRVGRGGGPSYCVLVSEAKGDASRARLRVLCQSNDGFHLAEEDLRLRGPGDFFGVRQHGLPQLRIANLAEDMCVLREAQEAARGLLAEDPKLEKAEHQPLKERILRLFEEYRDSFT